MANERRVWGRDELLVAFNLYCRLPFGQLRSGNPAIVRLAGALGRSASSVSMKLCNFASFDPAHWERGVKGLNHAARGDKAIWDEFHSDWEGLAFESEGAMGRLLGAEAEPEAEEAARVITGATEGERVVRVRLVQRFFRQAVLSSYGNACGVCALGIIDLLNASHIVPWARDEKRRADPCNGLALCALHDRAFDRGYMTFDEKCRVAVAADAKIEDAPDVHRVGLIEIEGRALRLPERFRPDAGALEWHRERVFLG